MEPYSHYRIVTPVGFEDVFSHFYFAENNSNQTITKTLLPSYQTILVFNFGTKAILHSKQNSKITVDRCLVLGLLKKAFDYSLPPGSQILVVNFIADAFYQFFGHASLVENLPLDPDSLLGKTFYF